MKVLLTIEEASDATGFSYKDLMLAITQNYVDSNAERYRLPPLEAKRGKRNSYLITRQALEQWAESLPDA